MLEEAKRFGNGQIWLRGRRVSQSRLRAESEA